MNSGKITLICGPMYSGKTTEMLRLFLRADLANKKTILLRPYSDTRQYISHSKTDVSWLKYEFVKNLNDFDAIKYDVIGVDEGQFQLGLKDFCKEYAKYRKQIIISALHATSECEMFDSVIEIIPHCDEIIKLNAVCSYCGSDYGSFTFYKGGNKIGKVEVGGQEKYIALCRECYEKEQRSL